MFMAFWQSTIIRKLWTLRSLFSRKEISMRRQKASLHVVQISMYSYSQINIATIVCFPDAKLIASTSIMNRYPLLYFCYSPSLPNSNYYGTMLSSPSYYMASDVNLEMHYTTCFTEIQCLFSWRSQAFQSLPNANALLRLVWILWNILKPIALYYGFEVLENSPFLTSSRFSDRALPV